jgi:hypothetical protein
MADEQPGLRLPPGFPDHIHPEYAEPEHDEVEEDASEEPESSDEEFDWVDEDELLAHVKERFRYQYRTRAQDTKSLEAVASVIEALSDMPEHKIDPDAAERLLEAATALAWRLADRWPPVA